MTEQPTPHNPPRQGYPLGALFVLTAACAVLVAMAAPVGRAVADNKVGGAELAVACLISGGVAMAMGLVIGMHHHRKLRGALWGLLAGFVIGPLAGAIALVPADSIAAVLYASLGGSAILIGIGATLRFTSGRN